MDLRTEIRIDAPAERVWAILTDLDAYPEWNPFIRRISGTVAEGETLDVSIHPPGGRSMRFRPTVLRVSPHRELRWVGKLLLPGFFDGEHVFEIEPLGPSSVRFVQRERFIGVAVPFLRWVMEKRTLVGFEEMNEALKERAESGSV